MTSPNPTSPHLTLTPATPPAAQAAPATGQPPVDPLAALRDIHLPDAVPFWPPAPGWWALAGTVVVLIALGALYEWYRRGTLRYRVAKEFAAVAADEARFGPGQAVAAEAAVLIRRVLIARGRASETVTLTGAGWESFLTAGKGAMPPAVAALVARAPYAPPGALDGGPQRAEVVRAVTRWLRGNT